KLYRAKLTATKAREKDRRGSVCSTAFGLHIMRTIPIRSNRAWFAAPSFLWLQQIRNRSLGTPSGDRAGAHVACAIPGSPGGRQKKKPFGGIPRHQFAR